MATRRLITPGSSAKADYRVLRSPLSDDEIWKRLKRAGFDEHSVQHKDKATIVSYIAKLEAQIYDHQHHMGLLILERKELASKYEEVKALVDSTEFMNKHDSAMNIPTMNEARKREESLKKTVGVKEACIASLEKALCEMRTECAETKVSAQIKFSEAHQLIGEAQKKIAEAEAKLHAAKALQGKVNQHNSDADRKLRDVEEREDDLRQKILCFKSDGDEKEKEIILERQCLPKRRKGLQQEQERLLQSQALLNQREDHLFIRSQELDRLQKELEVTKKNIDKDYVGLCDVKTNLKLIEVTLTGRKEAITIQEAELNEKEQELLDFKMKLDSRESDDVQKVTAGQEAAFRKRKIDFEAELQSQLKSAENEIEAKKRTWELKEVDLKHREDQVTEREHELEILSCALHEKQKDLMDMSSALKEKDQSLRVVEKDFELNKALLQKEKEENDRTKLDIQKSLVSLESNLRQIHRAKDRLEAMKSETDDMSVLVVKLKEEIDLVRSQKLELVAEADKLKSEKAKFEAEWELLDEKKEELRNEAKCIADGKKLVSTFIKNKRNKLRQEKENFHSQYTRDLESLASEREEFMNKMAHEHDEWFSKMQQERSDFLGDIEMQKRNLNILIEKRHEEIEIYLKEREKAFEEEKNNELQLINDLKDKAAEELRQVSFEMEKLQAERMEISLDREQRNKEWVELNNCIGELKAQRDKLEKQRELLHSDRIEICAQTEELKKLDDLKIISDNIAITEMLKSDMDSNRQKISANRNLKQWTPMHGNHKNSPKERDANNISNGFDTPFVHKSSVVSPPSPSRFSLIKGCAELIFNHSSEKLHTNNGDKVVSSDASNHSKGPKYSKNGKQLKRQQTEFSSAEPKVILDVPSPAKHINRMSDSESEIKTNVHGKIVPLLSDEHRVGRLKRGGGNLGNEVGDPLLHTRQHKKLRPYIQPVEHLLDQGATCSAIPSKFNVSKVHESSILSNQTHGNTEDTRVVMVDKVLHVSETTSVKVDCIVVPKQEVEDHLHNHTTGAD